MRNILSGALAALLSACAVGPNYHAPKPEAPPAFVSGIDAAFASEELTRDFWRQFDDELLTRLVGAALDANHDIRIAEARVRQVRALRNESRFDLGPTVQAEGSHTRSRVSERQLPSGSPNAGGQDYYQAGFDAVWELDFFGRIRRGVEARNAELGAADGKLRDVQVTVTAEVARNYLELRGLQQQLAVAQRNAENQRKTFDLTNVRLDAGRGTELDTARASAQLNSTLAGIPDLEAAVNRAMFRLGVLTGAGPTSLIAELGQVRPLPKTPLVQGIGTPEALLRRRPDVRIAERELAGATARIGLAVGDLFPKVSFTGSFGYAATDAGDLGIGASETYAFGPRISWAAFDIGRVRQQIKAAEAGADAALVRYEQAVIGALEDTESALTTYTRAQSRQLYLRAAASASAQASQLALLRFEGGVVDFLTVLDAERSLLEAESELARSETQTATALVAVYKALGGGFTAG